MTVEPLAAGFAVVLAALAAILATLALVAGRRFGERRFLLLACAFGLVALTAVFALVAELDLTHIVWFDETFALEPVPLALLTIALVIIYGAMAAPRRRASEDHAGRA